MIHCCFCIWYLHCLRYTKIVDQIVVTQWIHLFFLQYDLHDSREQVLPCVSSKIHQLQQCKRILSCVLQLCDRFPCTCHVEVCKALRLALECPPFYAHFSWYPWIHWVTPTWSTNFPMSQAIKIPDAKAAVEKEWETTRENTGMAADGSQKQKWGDRWSKEYGSYCSFCVVNGSLSSQEFGKSSRSIEGKEYPNFEMLDARNASLLWIRSSWIPTSRKRSVWRNSKLRKRIGFFGEDRSLTWFATAFESLVLMIPFLITLICSQLLFATMMFRKIRYEMGCNSIVYDQDPTCESDQLKTVLELYDMEIHQKISKPTFENWRQWWREA